MLFDIASLESDFRRRVELLDIGVVTKFEAASHLLMVCCVAMLDCPNQWAGVFQALEVVPVRLLNEVAKLLAEKKRPNGEWEWPPVGGIASGSAEPLSEPSHFSRPADFDEVRVYEVLSAWLSEKLSTR